MKTRIVVSFLALALSLSLLAFPTRAGGAGPATSLDRRLRQPDAGRELAMDQ